MPNIKKLFEEYRRIYNSDLFKEGLCDEFEFDEGILSEVFENLRGYFGETLPYDFSIIEASLMGNLIYVNKLVNLSKNHYGSSHLDSK